MTDETPLVEPGVFDFDDDDNLVLPKNVTEKKVRRKKLSPSTMNSLVDTSACPARFAAEKVIPRTPDPFGAAEIGTSGHLVLEHLFSLPSDQRTAGVAREIMDSQADSALFPMTSKMDPDKDDHLIESLRKKWLGEVEDSYKGIFEIEDVTVPDVFGRERWIGKSVKIAGVPLSGIIDRIDNLPDTTLSPIDYKTGKVKAPSKYGDPHGDQLRLYALAIDQEFGTLPSEAKVYYTKHAKMLSVDLSDKKLNDVEGKVSQSWEDLSWACDESTFETVASPLCGWCPLVNICPTAKAAGRTAKVSAPTPVQLGATIPVGPPSLSEGEKKTTKEATAVAEKKPKWREDKPWVETVGTGKNQRINPNAYAATAVFGLASRALADISGYNKSVAGEPVDAFPINRTTVEGLARTYAVIITDVQDELSTDIDWSAGLNTRLRSALFTATELHAPPFGGVLDDWDQWVERVKKNIVLLTEIGEGIYDEPDEDDPWIDLAVEDAVASGDEDSDD